MRFPVFNIQEEGKTSLRSKYKVEMFPGAKSDMFCGSRHAYTRELRRIGLFLDVPLDPEGQGGRALPSAAPTSNSPLP